MATGVTRMETGVIKIAGMEIGATKRAGTALIGAKPRHQSVKVALKPQLSPICVCILWEVYRTPCTLNLP